MMKSSHVNPEEAVAAALDLRAEAAVAMHFGTFDLSDEALNEPPKRFLQAAKDQGLGKKTRGFSKSAKLASFKLTGKTLKKKAVSAD